MLSTFSPKIWGPKAGRTQRITVSNSLEYIHFLIVKLTSLPPCSWSNCLQVKISSVVLLIASSVRSSNPNAAAANGQCIHSLAPIQVGEQIVKILSKVTLKRNKKLDFFLQKQMSGRSK